MSVTCVLCNTETADALGLLHHLRVMHPDVESPSAWPDGELVIEDCTLEPDDFGGAA